MTTIFYMDGALYADKRNVNSGIPAVTRDSGEKLHISSSNDFAYAVCGQDTYKKYDFENQLRNLISMIKAVGMWEPVVAEDYKRILGKANVKSKALNVVCDSLWICITNDLVIGNMAYTSSLRRPFICVLDPNDVHAMGSGGHLAIGASYVTRDPKKIFTTVNAWDELTSPTFEVVKADALDDFVPHKKQAEAAAAVRSLQTGE